MIDFLGDFDDGFAAPNETFCKGRLVVGLLLEDEAGEEGDDLLGLKAECLLAITRDSRWDTHFASTFSRISSVSTNSSAE
jgi:hypothetical protein